MISPRIVHQSIVPVEEELDPLRLGHAFEGRCIVQIDAIFGKDPISKACPEGQACPGCDGSAPHRLGLRDETQQALLELLVLERVGGIGAGRTPLLIGKSPGGTKVLPESTNKGIIRRCFTPECDDVLVERIDVAPECADGAGERADVLPERIDIPGEWIDVLPERTDVLVKRVDVSVGRRNHPRGGDWRRRRGSGCPRGNHRSGNGLPVHTAGNDNGPQGHSLHQAFEIDHGRSPDFVEPNVSGVPNTPCSYNVCLPDIRKIELILNDFPKWL